MQQRAEGVAERGSRPGSVRAAAGRGLEKLKKMSLRRVGSGGGSRGGSAREEAAPPAGAGGGFGMCRTAQAAAPSRAAGGFVAPAAGAPPEQPPEYADAPVALARCGGCGRSFNETALARHAKVGARVLHHSRSVIIGGDDQGLGADENNKTIIRQ